MNNIMEWKERYFIPKNKLIASVIFGWSVIIFNLVLFPLVTEGEAITLGIFIAGILLSIRYSMMKPILKAGAAGIGVVSLGMVIQSLFPRGGNGIAMGAFLGAIFILFLLLIKNIIISMWYLSKETVYLYQITRDENLTREA